MHLPKKSHHPGFSSPSGGGERSPWDPSLQGERDLQELAGRSHPKVRGPATFRGV